MSLTRIAPEDDPIFAPEVLPATLRALSCGQAMGFLAGRSDDLRITHDEIRRFLDQLAAEHIAQHSLLLLSRCLDQGAPLTAAELDSVRIAFDNICDALRDNPVPGREWASLQRYLDADGLAALLGVSKSSVLRYSRQERDTPDDVAARLHWLALVVGYLTGTYNALGVRRWFARPRRALDGQSPRELLLSENPWSPDGENARRIEELARASTGMVVT